MHVNHLAHLLPMTTASAAPFIVVLRHADGSEKLLFCESGGRASDRDRHTRDAVDDVALEALGQIGSDVLRHQMDVLPERSRLMDDIIEAGEVDMVTRSDILPIVPAKADK
jgi:hypothetical protein